MALGQKQSVASLNLVLYNRALHPELFDIYHDCSIVESYFDASIWVTGCSHVIRFSVGDLSITEVIAEADDELPERGLVASFRCRGEKQHQYDHETGVRYMMNLQTESVSEKVYAKVHADLSSSGDKRGLFVPFPQWQVGDLTPFTYVDMRATPRGLHVFAFHTFPEDLTVIKTQTLFELP